VPDLITEPLVRWLMTPAVMEDFPSLEDLTNRPAWMERGACRGEDRDLFFPVLGASTARAKAVCSGCPVRSECLDYATADPEIAGIWGGTSAKQRQKLRGERLRGVA
jgi:WhiB family redox-sensing transcriptional regulator